MDQHEQRPQIGQPLQNIYAVRSGLIKSYETDLMGTEQILHFYYQGEIIGFEAIYSKQYPFSFTAIDDTMLCEIPFNDLMAAISHEEGFQQQMIALMSQRINTGTYLLCISAEEKLIKFLADLIKRRHVTTATVKLPMTQQDIANYLRLAPETISRIFHRWRKLGIIKEVANKTIQLDYADKLKRLIEKKPFPE